MIERRLDRGPRRDRLGKGEMGAMRRHRPARRDGFAATAQDLIEPARQRLAETRDQRSAREAGEGADTAEAEFLEAGHDLRRETQSRDGQAGECGAFRLRHQDEFLGGARIEARQRPGGRRRARQRERGGETEAAHACQEIGEERRLAAEQMRRTRDVEPDAGGAVCDLRRSRPKACSVRTNRRDPRAGADRRPHLRAASASRARARAHRRAAGRD